MSGDDPFDPVTYERWLQNTCACATESCETQRVLRWMVNVVKQAIPMYVRWMFG